MKAARQHGKLWLVLAILLSMTLILVACGGGGGGSRPAPSLPQIGLDQTTLTFTASSEGGANPADKQFIVTNSGSEGTTLDWSVSEEASWLTVSPASGSLAKGESVTVTVSVDIAGLLQGTRNASITVAATGLTAKTIGAQLTIGAALAANPGTLPLTVAQGSSPADQTVTLANASSLSVPWSATSDSAWLTVTPSSGSFAAGGPGTPLTIKVNAATLTAGSYTGTITVTPNAAVSPVTITVNLTVTAVAAASQNVFIGGTAGIGQLSGLLASASVRKAAAAAPSVLADAKVTITVIKPDGSKSVFQTKTNEQGAYSAAVTAAAGDMVAVLIEKDGFTSLNKTIEVKADTQAQYTVSGNVAQSAVQVVKAENGVFKASGGTGPGFRFGLMRKRSGQTVPFASGASVRRAAVSGDIPDVDINVPASWAPGATAVKAELAAFDPSQPAERQMFPGEFVGVGGGSAAAAKADTTEYALESVAFFQAEVAPNNGQPLTPTLATGASKAAAEQSLIYKWIPDEGCGAMQKYEDRDPTAPGVQVPIYTYNPSQGKWGYLGEGTIKLWNGASYDTVPEGEVVDTNNGGKLTNLACGVKDYYFEIVASEWYTWWNLDYPLLFAEPQTFTISGKVVDQLGNAIPGAFIEADGYAKGANSYAYTYAGSDGSFSFELAVDDAAKLANYEYTAYSYATWPALSTVFTAMVLDAGAGTTKNVGNVTIVDTLTCSVSGKILQETGNNQTAPAPEWTWVSLYTGDYTFNNWVYTDATGAFTSKAPCSVPINLNTWNDSFTANVNNSLFGREASDNGTAVVLRDIVVVNAAPEVSTWIYPNPVKAGQTVELWASAWDYDGDYPLTYAWSVKNEAGATVATSDIDGFYWTPAVDGTYTAQVTVTDSAGKEKTLTQALTVNPDINAPPEIYWTWAAPPETCGGQPTLYVYAYDPDGDALTYAFSDGAPQYDSLSGGWVPTAPLAGSTVTVTVTDDGSPAASSSAIIDIPQASSLQLYSAEAWPAAPTVQAQVQLYAYAYSDSGVTYAWSISAPDGSAVAATPYYPGDNSWAYFTPDQAGDYAVTLTVTGGACGETLTRGFVVTASPLSVALTNQYVQYRTYENPAQNRFQGWVEYKDAGQLMQPWDFFGSSLLDATDTVLSDTPVFRTASFLAATWDGSAFGPTTPQSFSGWAFTGLGTLPAGDYTFETALANGAVIASTVAFPGQTALPVVASSSMTYQWNNGSLVLNWTAPAATFDTYRVVLYDVNATADSTGEVFHGTVPPGVNTVTLSASLLQAIRTNAGLSSLSSFGWEMQTRNYDGNNMNDARGYSNRVLVSPPPGGVDVIIR